MVVHDIGRRNEEIYFESNCVFHALSIEKFTWPEGKSHFCDLFYRCECDLLIETFSVLFLELCAIVDPFIYY